MANQVTKGESTIDAARDDASALPDGLYQTIRSFMPSRCILTALELDLFTAVGDGATAEEAAASIQANARATAMLLNALVALELLVKDGGRFRNTPQSSRFFRRGSRDNHRDGLLHTVNLWHRWSYLTEAVRGGAAISLEQESTPEWTERFIAGMHRNAKDRLADFLDAVGRDEVRRVLDLGGGSGIYAIAFAQASPSVRCEILDVARVVPLTARYVEQAGLTSQVTIRAGDMLRDDLGSDFDLVLLNGICHMFSPEQNLQLFRRVCRALAPGGRLVVQDFLLNSDKTGPLHSALFSLQMLLGTASGESYSEREFTSWMAAAGFADVRRIDLPGPTGLVIGRAP